MKQTIFIAALGLIMSFGTMQQAQGAVAGSLNINTPGVGVGITVGDAGYDGVSYTPVTVVPGVPVIAVAPPPPPPHRYGPPHRPHHRHGPPPPRPHRHGPKRHYR